jgi:hypothetical protein
VRELQHRLGYSKTSNLVAEYELKFEIDGLHAAFMDKVHEVHGRSWGDIKDSQLADVEHLLEQRANGAQLDALLERLGESPTVARSHGLRANGAVSAHRTAWHFFFTILLRRRAPRWVEGFLELLSPEERVAGLTPEQRLAGLSPDQTILALPDEVLRTLPEAYVASLPEPTREAVHKRLGR